MLSLQCFEDSVNYRSQSNACSTWTAHESNKALQVCFAVGLEAHAGQLWCLTCARLRYILKRTIIWHQASLWCRGLQPMEPRSPTTTDTLRGEWGPKGLSTVFEKVTLHNTLPACFIPWSERSVIWWGSPSGNLTFEDEHYTTNLAYILFECFTTCKIQNSRHYISTIRTNKQHNSAYFCMILAQIAMVLWIYCILMRLLLMRKTVCSKRFTYYCGTVSTWPRSAVGNNFYSSGHPLVFETVISHIAYLARFAATTNGYSKEWIEGDSARQSMIKYIGKSWMVRLLVANHRWDSFRGSASW